MAIVRRRGSQLDWFSQQMLGAKGSHSGPGKNLLEDRSSPESHWSFICQFKASDHLRDWQDSSYPKLPWLQRSVAKAVVWRRVALMWRTSVSLVCSRCQPGKKSLWWCLYSCLNRSTCWWILLQGSTVRSVQRRGWEHLHSQHIVAQSNWQKYPVLAWHWRIHWERIQ